MQITNNLFLLSGASFSAVGDAATLGEVYGIRTPKGLIIIDCGAPKTGPVTLKETLTELKVNEPITHVILTHGHWDHAGGAKELQESGAKIIVGKEDAIYCTNGGVKGMRSPFDDSQLFPAFTPDITIIEDSFLEINNLNFEFIKIPGHSPGSIAIRVEVDGKIAMFTGDALQPDGTLLEKVTLGWQGDPAFSKKDIVDSMMKLIKYETDLILPGHGKICLRNGTKVLRFAAQTAFLTMR